MSKWVPIEHPPSICLEFFFRITCRNFFDFLYEAMVLFNLKSDRTGRGYFKNQGQHTEDTKKVTFHYKEVTNPLFDLPYVHSILHFFWLNKFLKKQSSKSRIRKSNSFLPQNNPGWILSQNLKKIAKTKFWVKFYFAWKWAKWAQNGSKLAFLFSAFLKNMVIIFAWKNSEMKNNIAVFFFFNFVTSFFWKNEK